MMLTKEPGSFAGVDWKAFPTGDAEHPIRILNWPGERPAVKGSAVVTDWKKHKGDIYVKDWPLNSQQVFCDGKILQQIGGELPKDLAIWFRGKKGKSLDDLEKGSFYCDVAGKKLYVWLADGGDPNRHEMEVSVRPQLLWLTISYCHVRGLTFMDNNWREGDKGKPGPINASDLIFPNPEISSNDGNVSDYNLFYRSNKVAGTFAHNWGEKSFDNLKAWQEQAGQDKHSIIAEPLFADAGKYDFRPAKGSPAIRLVRPKMGAGIDREGTRRDDRAYYTAGPFEAPPGFAPPPPPKPTTLPPPQAVTLPAEFVKPLATTGAMAPFTEALKELDTKTVDGKTVVTIKGIQFTLMPGKAMLLTPAANKIRIPVNKGVMKLYLLHAIIDAPENRMVGLCKVLRQDGMGIGLDWYTPANIGPSVGEWNGKMTEKAADRKTEVAWQSKNGKVRLFLTTWDNDNYWYPIRDLEWNLMDNKPTLVVLGITVQPDK
jgi:hypothetical protein